MLDSLKTNWSDEWSEDLVMDPRGIEAASAITDAQEGFEEYDEPEFIERPKATEPVEVVDSNWFYNSDYYNRMYQDVGGEG